MPRRRHAPCGGDRARGIEAERGQIGAHVGDRFGLDGLLVQEQGQEPAGGSVHGHATNSVR